MRQEDRHVIGREELESHLARIRGAVRGAERLHPDWPTDEFKQLTIITEEVGETAQAALRAVDEGGDRDRYEKELLHVGAMVVRALAFSQRKRDGNQTARGS